MELNVDFDSIIDKDYNIIILNHQPGIGKTTSVMNYIKQKLEDNSKFRFFYFTDKHKTIKEHLSTHFKNIDTIHWKGFEHFTTYKDPVELYKDYHLNAAIIDNITDIGKNSLNDYNRQFFDADILGRVFSPFNYLKSNQFHKIEKDIIFLDENISQLITFSLDEDLTNQVFKNISSDMGEKWADKLTNRDFYYFIKKDIQNTIIDSYSNTVVEAYKKDNSELLNLLKKFNPYEFKEYINLGSIYKWKNKSYSFPLYYYGAFDEIEKNTPIVILDASFNKFLFSYFLESYNGEIRKLGYGSGFKDLNVYILNSNHQQPHTNIYRMHPGGAYPKSSIIGYPKETKETISTEIKKIIEVFGIENVGLITYKEIADKVEYFGIDIEYFGNLRGTNILEKKPVLLILGTWLPLPPKRAFTDIEKKYQSLENLIWQYFLLNIKDNEIIDTKASAPQIVHDENIGFKLARAHISSDKKISKSGNLADIAEKNPVSMLNLLFFSEIYQAYHRNRGLRDNKIIFSYGWFPEPGMLFDKSIKELFYEYDLRNEFNIRKIFSNEELESILKSFIDIFDKWKKFIMDIDNKEKSNTKIANEYNIWKGPASGQDVTLIKEIRDKIHNKFKKELGLK